MEGDSNTGLQIRNGFGWYPCRQVYIIALSGLPEEVAQAVLVVVSIVPAEAGIISFERYFAEGVPISVCPENSNVNRRTGQQFSASDGLICR